MQQGRLLIFCHGVPHASRGASSVLFFHYTAALKAAGHAILNVLLLDTSSERTEGLEAYQQQMAGTDFQIVICRAEQFIRRKPGGFELVEAPLEPAVAAARNFGAQAAFCLDLTCAWAAQRMAHVPRIVWLGDLNFQTTWHHAVCKAKEDPRCILRLPSAWKKARQWRRTYNEVLADAAEVIVSSHSSVRLMQELQIPSVYHPYPWPAPDVIENQRPRPPASALPSFLFCGTLNALGSKSALLFLLKKLYPRLLSAWGRGRFRLFIAGRGAPPDWTRQAMADKPEVEFLGFVEELDTVMARCHAMVVPIDIPVGNRSRIVTAMSRGWLVVAHRFVSETNPDLVDGETCLLAGDVETFAAKMRQAVEQPDEAARIVERARQCYQERFAVEPACRPLLAAVARQIAAPPR